MRSTALAAALLLVAGCSAEAPSPSQAPSSSPAQPSSSAPAESPSPSESAQPSAPAVAPSVEGEWKTVEIGPMLSDGDVDGADLPDGLKAYLKEAILDQVLLEEEYADEFPDCPVEARVTALHPAGFAVATIAGCGPDAQMGVIKATGDEWDAAVLQGNETPACQELADEGVPAKVPVDWDEGFRCTDGDGWRYW